MISPRITSKIVGASLGFLIYPLVANAETITIIILSDRTVERVLFPGDGRTQMMTLEQFQLCNPFFADADLETIVSAGTEVLQPIGGGNCLTEVEDVTVLHDTAANETPNAERNQPVADQPPEILIGSSPKCLETENEGCYWFFLSEPVILSDTLPYRSSSDFLEEN